MTLLRKLVSAFTVLAVFVLDRWSKHYVQNNFTFGIPSEVTPYFHITYVENTGIAFGLGQGGNLLFIISTLVILGTLLWMRRRWEKDDPDNLKLKIGISLVIAGAIGNLYDRIVYGHVVDFLDFFVGSYHWPAFNVADSSICAGAFLLAISQWNKASA